MDVESKQLLESYINGEDEAATEIYNKYLLRLVALVQRRLSNSFKPRVDPEDIVQSAYRSFFRKAKDGAFSLERSGDLWRLLAGITVKKLLKRIEKERAGKRNPTREVNEAPLHNYLSQEPSPEADLILVEQLAHFMESLDQRDRRILELRLQDENVETIAGDVQASEATVRRILRRANGLLRTQLLEA